MPTYGIVRSAIRKLFPNQLVHPVFLLVVAVGAS